MDKETIRVLRQLQRQLQDMESLGEADEKLVEQLRNNIELLLSHSKKVAASSHSVREQLEEGVERFEVSHPELTAVMARLIDALSNMGI
jgi:endonuclease III